MIDVNLIDVNRMRIGEVAAAAAVNAQTLRYYERVGLLPEPARRSSGYREYDVDTVRRVRFIKRAQDLGFTLSEIADLLALREQSETACEQVEARASATLERIGEKIHDLEQMRAALSQYVRSCRRGRPVAECPLLRALDRSVEEANGSSRVTRLASRSRPPRSTQR
ncbi:MAG: heavy metal-responsive transcriptional regulator [Gemmatimonadaceae bacterium]